ncbi:response regulator transcription factor [Pedobacter africanus]|uniref:Response regulator receiver domain-containing protein n=1 Tax=Pedobacter africanus TaxID=151894 RepID=A0A1W2AF61_9SPHI|nr:response regulator [Pedobacter africanus]SMC59306.1 Response regulator receiver domain-containing protein [Pedobacter africanus]
MDTPKQRIYIVEDNSDIGFILELFLNEEGFAVKVLSTAKEFNNALKKGMPDLFLLDVMLPDGNGIDICHRLKNDPRSKRLPILIMSAQSNQDAAKNCEAEEFIAKPFDLFILLRKIKQCLSAA